MTAKNDITGDDIKSRASNDTYRDNWDKIFSKKPRVTPEMEETLEKIKKELEEITNKNISRKEKYGLD